VQCGIPGGEPLYPKPITRLFVAIIKEAYCFLEHVENIGANDWHAFSHLISWGRIM
jgi:hypothetical protein